MTVGDERHYFKPKSREKVNTCAALQTSISCRAGRHAVLLARWIVRSVPLEIVGSSGHEKVPTRENRVWSTQEDHEERGSKDHAEITCGPHSDSFNDTSKRGRSNCSTNNFQNLAEANLKSKRPFCALPLTPEHRQLRLQWYQARSMWNVTDWQKVVFSDEFRIVLGTDDNRVRCGGALVSGTIPPTLFYVTLPAQMV
ncbi:hypothetical protein TNCV_4485141 [Trichonephila clavipes]|nr:hypothetical protein TNCV_4485141 [Trichonephila clavipes]